MIPKTLHFTYKSDDIPRFYEENLKRWSAYCPDWEMLYYSDEKVRAFFRKHFPEYHEDVQKISQGAVLADVFRYAVLFVHGGMYNDIDTIPLKNIPEDWLSYRSVIGYEYQPSRYSCINVPSFTTDVLCQWSLLSQKGNPLFKEALETCIENLRAQNHVLRTSAAILKSTGPLHFTAIATPYLDRQNLLLLDMDVFSPLNMKKDYLDNCVVFHQYHGKTGWKFELKCPHIKLV